MLEYIVHIIHIINITTQKIGDEDNFQIYFKISNVRR